MLEFFGSIMVLGTVLYSLCENIIRTVLNAIYECVDVTPINLVAGIYTVVIILLPIIVKLVCKYNDDSKEIEV